MQNNFKENEFTTLVHASAHNRHRAVLKAAADLFSGNHHPTKDEILHFEELNFRLLPKLDISSRAQIAQILAPCTHLPKATPLFLAKDDFSVAQTILAQYQNFSETDLLSILAQGDAAHALAIAGRKDLTDNTLIALSRLAEVVTHSVEETEDDISQSTEVIEENNQPETSVSTHTDEKNILTNSSSERRGNSRMHNFTVPNLERFLKSDHTETLSFAHECEALASSIVHDPATVLRDAYRRAEIAADFSRLARLRDAHSFCVLLCKSCKLNGFQARKIVQDKKGFALAICLKALSLPQDVANEAFILLNPSLGEDSEQIFLLDWFYRQVSPASARLMVENWTGSAQHQPLHEGRSRSEALTRRTTSLGSVNPTQKQVNQQASKVTR